VVVDPKEHGLAAAAMTQEILGGKKPGDVPVVTNQDGFAIVDVKTAENWGSTSVSTSCKMPTK
jgi:ABC-type uncharacterized transport system substrate-binding protein